MLNYAVKRILQVIPMLIVLTIVVFLMVRLAPGDPVQNMLGLDVPPEMVEIEREKLGLNDPLHTQYIGFVKELFRGNLGESIVTRKPIVDELMRRFPNTIILAVGGTIVGALIGILFGIIASIWHNKFWDNVIMVLSLLFVSTPSFFLAMLFILYFTLKLGWLPSIGLDTPAYAVLPILTLGLQGVGFIARTTRSSMLDVINQDYIRTSRSRGIPNRVIIYVHALRNAIIPVVTAIGLKFGVLLSGAAIVETVFSINGVGRFIVDSVSKQDYPAIQGSVLVLAVTFVVINTIVDITYAYIDPRIKYE